MSPRTPGLHFEFTARITLGPIVELGAVAGVRKRIVPITGGDFSGPRIRGRVVPGGGDWQSILPDGSAQVRALYVLEASDGAMIGITNTGLRRGSADALARLAAGELVDPSEYYFRATPVFDVADGPHQWLKENIFVAVGARYPDSVSIDVFRLD